MAGLQRVVYRVTVRIIGEDRFLLARLRAGDDAQAAFPCRLEHFTILRSCVHDRSAISSAAPIGPPTALTMVSVGTPYCNASDAKIAALSACCCACAAGLARRQENLAYAAIR